MKNKKWNYAVVKSIFGDLWVGKTALPVKDEVVFSELQNAIDKATDSFLEHHPCFEPDVEDDEEDYDDETAMAYNDLVETTEETAEEINKGIERFIVE